jgi:hypothetical protein
MLVSKIKEIRNGRVIVKDSKMKDVEPSSEQIGKIVGLVMSSEKDPTRAIAMIQNKISSEFHLSMEEREKLLPQIKMAISVYNNFSKDSKTKDANPDGTISPDEEKRMAELLREANESKSRLKAKAYEIGGSFRGPGNWKRVKSILTSDSKTKDKYDLVWQNDKYEVYEDENREFELVRKSDKSVVGQYATLQGAKLEASESSKVDAHLSKTKDVKTFNSEEDWRATVREIGGRVEEIQTDKNILFAYLSGNRVVGQFDRNKKKGVIEVKNYDSKVELDLSKTKDAWKIGESIKYFINGQANYGRIIDYDDSTNDGSVIYHVVSNKNPDKDYFITMNKEHSRQMSIHD